MPDNARAEDMNSRLLSPRSVTLTDMDTSFLERGSIHPAASGRVRSPRLVRLLFLSVGPGAPAPSSAGRIVGLLLRFLRPQLHLGATGERTGCRRGEKG